MSAAIAESPAKEVVLPPAGDAPTPAQKEAMLSFFTGKKAAVKDVVTDPAKEVTEVVKVDPSAATPKETPVAKAEVKAEPVKEVSDADRNFAALRQKAEAAEKAHTDAQAEIAKFKTEMEELRKKPAPEEFLKRLESTEKEKLEYQKRLREADLSRDPEFNAHFDTPIRSAMQRMVDIAVAAGVPKDEAVKTVTAWDKGTMAEWLDGTLGPVEKMEFGAEMQQAISLYSQKESALAQADQTWQGLVKQREADAQAQREQKLSILNTEIEANLKELGETPLGKEHTDLLVETRALLRRAGGLEGERVPNKELLKMVGHSLLLTKGFQRQEKDLAAKAEKIAELEKTIAERDTFIKNLNGATPPIGGSLGAAKPDNKAAARAILNPVIN